MKILCLLVHYYNPNGQFIGKSSQQKEDVRRSVVKRCCDSLKSIRGLDLNVLGVDTKNLVNIDIQYSKDLDPRLMIYEALNRLSDFVGEYDYVMAIEDDILVNNEIFLNISNFDEINAVNEILMPNRLEINGSHLYCIDTVVDH